MKTQLCIYDIIQVILEKIKKTRKQLIFLFVLQQLYKDRDRRVCSSSSKHVKLQFSFINLYNWSLVVLDFNSREAFCKSLFWGVKTALPTGDVCVYLFSFPSDSLSEHCFSCTGELRNNHQTERIPPFKSEVLQ